MGGGRGGGGGGGRGGGGGVQGSEPTDVVGSKKMVVVGYGKKLCARTLAHHAGAQGSKSGVGVEF